MDVIRGIISRIKEKKELINLDERVCQEYIVKYLRQHGKALARLSEAKDFTSIQRSKEADELVRAVRETIRAVYGVFQTEDIGKLGHKLDRLEEDLRHKPIERTKDEHDRILRLHRSTAERLEFYEQFFSDIFAITGRPKTILDLACGLNPMAWSYHQLRNVAYLATELNEQDVRNLQRYFDIIKPYTAIEGKAIKHDLKKDAIPIIAADVCFLLKVIDLLEPKTAERIITSLRCRWIIVSFPTKTITDQDMRFKRRAGFQKMLRRIGRSYQTLTYDNELVYVIQGVIQGRGTAHG